MRSPTISQVWQFSGPLVTTLAIYIVTQLLDQRFEAANPAFRGVNASTMVWISVGASLLVLATWLVAERKPLRTFPALNESNHDGTGPLLSIRSPLLRILIWTLAISVPLVVTGQVWHSYDFPTHVFFASHYQRTWWSLWEPRWFEGFNVASYPPLTHQIAAILGWVIGIGNAVNLLIGASVILFPIAVYRLAGAYFGPAVASRAAALAVVTPSVVLAAYAYGQLPTLFAVNAALLAGVALVGFLRQGGAIRGGAVVAWVGVVAASHHATAIFFLPPFLATIGLVEALRAPVSARLLRRGSFALIGIGSVVFGVILPFWLWHATEYVVQAPIDHQSRHDLLHDLIAQDLFFWAEHGVLVAAPLAVIPLLRRGARVIAPWYVLGLFLLILGLGGTTPLPRLVFGSQWEWLTYDRFSLWADVPLVLLLALLAARVLDGSNAASRWARAAWPLTLVLLFLCALVGALLPSLIQTEPPTIDPRPIADFLSQDNRDHWRYLTLGFGDQNGVLNASTNAATIDGDFFTARRIPQLMESGIGQIDYSLQWDPSARLLRELLADPSPHALRWVFTNDREYERILVQYPWIQRETLSNGVRVWESIRPVPEVQPADSRGGVLAVWWGVIPLATLACAVVLSACLSIGDRRRRGSPYTVAPLPVRSLLPTGEG